MATAATARCSIALALLLAAMYVLPGGAAAPGLAAAHVFSPTSRTSNGIALAETEHPALVATGPRWYNVSSGLRDVAVAAGLSGRGQPPAVLGAASASDPNSTRGSVTVLFGGQTGTVAESNQTWILPSGVLATPARWINISNESPQNPPALAFASMVFDPMFGSFLLFGGELASGALSNQTWGLSPKTWSWSNLSSSVCATGLCPGGRDRASMAFAPDFIDQETTLYGGCATASCSSRLGDTWNFNNTTGTFGWHRNSYSPSPSARSGAVFGDNWAGFGQSIFLFGGTLASGSVNNQSWIFYDHGWLDVTTQFGTPVAPPARTGATMLWYPAGAETILVGGANASGVPFNDTWGMSCSAATCYWTNLTPTMGGVGLAWMASGSDVFRSEPVLFGGVASATAMPGNGTYVLQNLTNLSASLSTTTPEVNSSVGLTPVITGGASNPGGAPDAIYPIWSLSSAGRSMVDSNVTAVRVPWATATLVTVDLLDGFDVARVVQWSLAPTGPSLSAVSSAASTDTGVAVRFTGTLGGTFELPVSYSWSFGDGEGSAGVSVTHAYATSGLYNASLLVTDALGNTASALAVVLVTAAPVLRGISVQPSSVTSNQSVQFSALLAGGAPPFAFVWAFGDGTPPSSSPTPSHAYRTAGTYEVNVTVTDNDTLAVVGHTNVTVAASPGSTGGPPPSHGNVTPTSSTPPSWLVPAAVGAIAVVLIVVGALVLRRRK